MRHVIAVATLGVGLALAGCQDHNEEPVADAGQASVPAQSAEAPAAAPVHGAVTDTEAFDRFLATSPTPEQFRQAYPDVLLVLPDDVSTRELRTDNSRFFAELDEQGRIASGSFR